nr:TetR-like C-terminal domain-containing protein [Micromonospora sp. DSM 115978]
ALDTLAAGLVPPRTGDLRSDLLALAPEVDAVFTEPRMSILGRCVAELAQFPNLYLAFRRESVDRCAAAIEDAFHEARLRGEASATLDPGLAADAFLGAFLARRGFGTPGARPEATFQERLVDFCVAAATAPPRAPVGSGTG